MRIVASILLVFCGAALAAETKPVAPSIEALAAYAKMSGFTVSPDGKHLAALEGRGEERVILVWKTDALSAPPTVIGSSKMKVNGVQFIKNDTLAVTLWQPYDLRFEGTTKTFLNKLFFTDLAGGKWREPIPQGAAWSPIEKLEKAIAQPTILDALPNDPAHVLVVDDVGVNQADIYKVEVESGRAVRVMGADSKVAGYVTDLEGAVRARLRLDTGSGGAHVITELRDPDSGTWQEHFKSYAKDRDVVQVLAFAKDANIAYVLSNVSRDKAAIYEYDIRARKLGEIVFEHRFFDAAGMSLRRVKDSQFGEVQWFGFGGPSEFDFYYQSDWFRDKDKQIAQALKLTEEPQQVIDPATGRSATVPMRTKRNWSLVSASLDRNTIVFQVESPSEPASFYLLRNNVLTTLSKAYPDIDPRALGEGKLVYYKARDGLDIPAFLYTPSVALCGAGPWKTVIHPHGGPWARDALAFDYSMWVPLMTSRCAAVLQPQFRGSEGWGRKLWMAGDAEWGQKMQDDKDDGAKWLIDQKVAIPGRIAMFGFSYGGYSAMAAAIRPNGLYKCAIAGAGVSDLARITATFYTNEFFRDGQASSIGGLNPVDHADKIKIPIHVYHGDRDTIVPIVQSRAYVAKAKKSDQPVTFQEFKDYAHGPAWSRATFAEQLRGIDNFFGKGCGGGGL